MSNEEGSTALLLAPMLSTVYMTGAARADANPEQLEQLRTGASVWLRNYTGEHLAEDYLEYLRTIMGPEWALTGVWLDALKALTDTT